MRTLLIARGWAHADLGGSLEYSYIKTFLGTIYHPMGTAAMLPRELGGKCRSGVGSSTHSESTGGVR